jgi:hypothetical protein
MKRRHPHLAAIRTARRNAALRAILEPIAIIGGALAILALCWLLFAATNPNQ